MGYQADLIAHLILKKKKPTPDSEQSWSYIDWKPENC